MAVNRRGPTARGWAASIVGVLLLASLLVLPVEAIGGLTGLSVYASSQRAGTVEAWTVRFTSPVAGDASGNRLEWTVPDGFRFQSPTCGLEGATGVTASVSGATVTCTIGAGSYPIGDVLAWTVTNVQAPGYEQTTPAFTTVYKNSAGVTLGSDGQATVVISHNLLQSVTAAARDMETGVTTTWVWTLQTFNAVAAQGDIHFTVPAGFELGDAASCTIAGLSGTTYSKTSATEGACNLNGAPLAAATTYSLTVSNIRNPLHTGSYAASLLETRTSTDAVVDQATSIAFALDPRHFDGTPTSTTSDDHAGATSVDWFFEGKLSNPFPAGDFVVLTFPPGFGFNSGGTTAIEMVSGSTAHFEAATITGPKLAAKLADGASIPAGTTIKIRATHIENPQFNPQNPEQTLDFIWSIANNPQDTIVNVQNFVEGILYKPPPECNQDDPSPACCVDHPDWSNCQNNPCPPEDNSATCCQRNNNCPPPPACDQLGTCPTVALTPGPPGGGPPGGPGDGPKGPGSGGGGGDGPGGTVYKLFSGAGPLGGIGFVLGAVMALLLVGLLGAGGYYRYRAYRKGKPKADGKGSKRHASGIPRMKP